MITDQIQAVVTRQQVNMERVCLTQEVFVGLNNRVIADSSANNRSLSIYEICNIDTGSIPVRQHEEIIRIFKHSSRQLVVIYPDPSDPKNIMIDLIYLNGSTIAIAANQVVNMYQILGADWINDIVTFNSCVIFGKDEQFLLLGVAIYDRMQQRDTIVRFLQIEFDAKYAGAVTIKRCYRQYEYEAGMLIGMDVSAVPDSNSVVIHHEDDTGHTFDTVSALGPDAGAFKTAYVLTPVERGIDTTKVNPVIGHTIIRVVPDLMIDGDGNFLCANITVETIYSLESKHMEEEPPFQLIMDTDTFLDSVKEILGYDVCPYTYSTGMGYWDTAHSTEIVHGEHTAAITGFLVVSKEADCNDEYIVSAVVWVAPLDSTDSAITVYEVTKIPGTMLKEFGHLIDLSVSYDTVDSCLLIQLNFPAMHEGEIETEVAVVTVDYLGDSPIGPAPYNRLDK